MDFQTQFYNLNGVHYKEVKQIFYKLLHCTDPEILLLQLPNIQPTNYLQRIFYVDILICTKQVEKLVKILQEGNGVLVSRILKQKWFFEEAFKSMSERDIVNEFLPTLSYSLKMKVLKKLALTLSEAKMNNIYDCLLERYGLSIAKQFLFSCSPAKIRQVLRDNELTLPVEQLKRLLARDSDLIKTYIESYKYNFGHDFNDYSFLSYVAWKHPKLYFDFGLQDIEYVKVGRQTTKKLLRLNKDETLKAENTVLSRLNVSVVSRQVQEDYFQKYLPSNEWNETVDLWKTILKKYPQKKRWAILSSAFQKRFKDSILNHLDLFDGDFAQVFPKNVRQTWAQLMFKRSGDFVFITHFETNEGFSLIKEKIKVTADRTTRGNLLTYLIKMCHVNKDYRCYEKVLRYIRNRHCNEKSYIRQQILYNVSCNIDDGLTTDEFWAAINELVELARIKGDSPPDVLAAKHLIYLFKERLPVERALKLYLTDNTIMWARRGGGVWNHLSHEPVIKKSILMQSFKVVAEIGLQTKREELLGYLFNEAVNFNGNNPDMFINLNGCPALVEYIKQVVAKDDFQPADVSCIKQMIRYNNYGWDSNKVLKVCTDDRLLLCIRSICARKGLGNLSYALLDAIKQPRKTAFQDSILDYFFSDYLAQNYCPYAGRHKALKHFLNNEPRVIVKYFQHIIQLETDNEPALDYSLIKLYSHLGLDWKVTAYFAPLVGASSDCTLKSNLIYALSKVMGAKDFLDLTAEYIPVEAKLDLLDADQNRLYLIQCTVLKALKNVENLIQLVPLLDSVCQGDYLQASLPSLDRVLYGVSEINSIRIIKQLMVKAVSAKKHSVYLGFELANQSTAIEIFQELGKDRLVRKHIFRGMFKYCLKNPSQSILEMVFKCLEFIDQNDTAMFQTLINSVQKLPKQFQPVFMVQIWKVIEQDEIHVSSYRTGCIAQINRFSDKMFLQLPQCFCEEVVRKCFFAEDACDSINKFACTYLLMYQDTIHFSQVFSRLASYKERHWNANNQTKLSNIFSFFEQAYKMFPNRHISFLKLFKTHWERLFSDVESYSENMLLHFMLIYMEWPNIEDFANKLHVTLHKLVHERGAYVSHLLLDNLNNFFEEPRLFGPCQVALQLLQIDQTPLICFLAISIAERNCSSIDKEAHNALLHYLKTVNDFYVKVRYNDLLKRL